jgi:Ala-tRNA(Pro) deacylase
MPQPLSDCNRLRAFSVKFSSAAWSIPANGGGERLLPGGWGSQGLSRTPDGVVEQFLTWRMTSARRSPDGRGRRVRARAGLIAAASRFTPDRGSKGADDMAKTRAELMAMLEGLAIATTTVDHPPLFTVEDSRAVHRDVQGGHTKNLFVKDKKGTVFLIVAEADRSLDLKTLHKAIGAQGRLSFVGAEQMEAMIGVRPGSVTAFALINDPDRAVRLVLDEGLLLHDMVNCHPLTNEATTTIRRDDLLRFFASTGHEPFVLALDAGTEDAPEAVSPGV